MNGNQILVSAVGCIFLSAWSISSAAQPTGAIAPATRALPGAQPNENYVLAYNDLIQVRVFQEEDLTSELRIGKDGAVTFPLVGSLKLGGKTLSEATTAIKEGLAKDYLVNPQVSISIIEFAKRRFTVLGQVNKPGSYEMPENESVTLLQAIAVAGGFTRIAKTGEITVNRNGKPFYVDAKKMAKDKDAKQFEIQPGDNITVDEGIF